MSNLIKRLEKLSNRQVLLVLFGTSMLAALISGFFSSEGFSTDWWMGYFDNLSSEMLGAFLTFLLLEMILGTREEKEDLMLDLASKDNATALNALKKIQESGWLADGTLNGINLEFANLQGADMRQAIMQKVNLRLANLQGAALIGADLQQSNLIYCNLQDTSLQLADLHDANFQDADLRGANLKKANMVNAKLDNASFDRETTLPDGELWTPDTDMEQFTDTAHSNFWQPDWITTQTIKVADLKPR
jgi:uncharacterized protein YjbI with pentapeptide repeats